MAGLELALSAVVPASCTEVEFSLLLGIFERFPDDDGFIFWSIVHMLEDMTGTNLHSSSRCSANLSSSTS